ncbi:MAG TPA: hypothetical protein VG389_23405 [Myxococcota bacterium]|jgi:hypothetical protein|nr:hypothetical protein [Myxococcota bacterium]
MKAVAGPHQPDVDRVDPDRGARRRRRSGRRVTGAARAAPVATLPAVAVPASAVVPGVEMVIDWKSALA